MAYIYNWGYGASLVMQCGSPRFDPWVQENPLEKDLAPHSSTLAGRIPWTEEPGGLQSTGSYRIWHDWAADTHRHTHLVVQWLRTRLPRQETRVQSLIWKDPTCHGAADPIHHSCWACALEPGSRNYWACVLQLLKPMLHSKRSTATREQPLFATREKPKQQRRPSKAK